MRRILLNIVLIFSVSSVNIQAQDFHLSQYDAAPLYLNPALTGLINGKFRIYSNYRSQWASIIPNAYKTMAFAADMPIKKFAAGFQIMNNKAGSGNFKTFGFLVSGAWDLKLDAKGSHMRAGLQAGVVQKSVDMSRLVFGNQYVGAGNGSFNTSISSGENYSVQSTLMPSISLGYSYYYSNINSRFNPFLGLAVYNLPNPKESILSSASKLPLRYMLHGGTKINVSEIFQIAPRVLYMRQTNVTEISFGSLFHYYLDGSNAFLILGGDYRLNDAGIIHLGLKKDGFIYRISYDVNTSTLQTYSHGRGATEFSVTYVPEKKRQKEKQIRNCTRL